MAGVQQGEYCFETSAHKTLIRYRWLLKDWSLLRDYYIGGTAQTPEIALSRGVKCKLGILHLRAGNSVDNRKIQTLTVQRLIEKPKSVCIRRNKCIVSVITEDMNKSITREVEQTGNTISEIIHLQLFTNNDSLQSYLRNDTLTLFFEILVVYGIQELLIGTNIENDNSSIDMCKKIQEMYISKKFNDITFVVAGHRVTAHKCVLAANSDVFKAMFSTKMKEREHSIVRITDIKFAVFDVLLRYMYGYKVNEIEHIVEDLIVAADKYRVMGLKNLCEMFMIRNTSDENADRYFAIANKLGCKGLKKKAMIESSG